MKDQYITGVLQETALWAKVEEKALQPAAECVKGQVEKTLVQNFVSMRSLSTVGSAFAFTSTRRGEGVSHVVEALGDNLARYTGSKVLVIRFADLVTLTEFEVRHLEQKCEDRGEAASVFLRRHAAGTGSMLPLVDLGVWSALRAKYQYILVDCPALEAGSQVLSLGKQVDGTVLVVRAGFGQKREIQQAARLLSFGSNRLLGCVLNRRTYPVPRWLYRWM